MKHLFLDLTALSPLAIRADHAPTGASSAPYIAGTTLLGSLAAVYRRAYPTQSDDFARLFLDGQIQYPNLYPATYKDERARDAEIYLRTEGKPKKATLGKQDEATLPIHPLPLTAQSCKRFPGFRNDGEDEPGHGVRDSLFAWAVFELGKDTSDPLVELRKLEKCPICEKAMHPLAGSFYRRRIDGQIRPLWAGTSVGTRLQTHTGINRETGTVQEGILYNREVYEEQARFSGIVKLPDELLAPLTNFIERFGKDGFVRVGTGRTRGLGKVEISTLALADTQFSQDAFGQRLDRFNEKLQAFVGKALKLHEPEKFYFALTLHSPAILYDALLRYRGRINEEALGELLELRAAGFTSTDFKLEYQAASIKRVTGWNELWGTPRMNESAIETGSVSLFSCKTEKREELMTALFKLEQEDIGQRRAEGFGRICISDPFHLEGINYGS